MDTKSKALYVTLISALIWGWAFISTKVLVEHLSSGVQVFVRYFIAFIFLFILLKLKESKTRLKKEDILLMTVTGILGISLCYFLATIALRTITPTTSGIINGTIPILTVLGEVIFFRKKISRKSTLGVFLSVLGVYIIVTGGVRREHFGGLSVGHILMFLSILSWVVYTFITKSLFVKYSSLAVITYQTFFGTIAIIPYVIYEGNFVEEIKLIFSDAVIYGNLLFLGIFCSTITYYAYNYGLAHLGVSTTSIFMNFVPAVTMLGSYLVLGEKITFFKFIGLIIIIISVFLVTTENMGVKDKRKRTIRRVLVK